MNPPLPQPVNTRSSVAISAARQLCNEARIVLTSLRNGPPHVARGDLAQELMELRHTLHRIINNNTNTNSSSSNGGSSLIALNDIAITATNVIATDETSLHLSSSPAVAQLLQNNIFHGRSIIDNIKF